MAPTLLLIPTLILAQLTLEVGTCGMLVLKAEYFCHVSACLCFCSNLLSAMFGHNHRLQHPSPGTVRDLAANHVSPVQLRAFDGTSRLRLNSNPPCSCLRPPSAIDLQSDDSDSAQAGQQLADIPLPAATGTVSAAEQDDAAAHLEMAVAVLQADIDRVQFKVSAARAGFAAGMLPVGRLRGESTSTQPLLSCLWLHAVKGCQTAILVTFAGRVRSVLCAVDVRPS